MNQALARSLIVSLINTHRHSLTHSLTFGVPPLVGVLVAALLAHACNPVVHLRTCGNSSETPSHIAKGRIAVAEYIISSGLGTHMG